MSEQLLVTLGVQDKGAKTQVSALNKELKLLDKEFKTVNTTSKTYEKGTDTLQKKLDTLAKKHETTGTKVEVYRKQIDNSKKSLEEKKKSLETLTNSEEDNEKQVQKLTSEISKMEADIRTATREMELSQAELESLGQEMQDLNNQIKQKPFLDMKHDLEEMGKSLENTGQKLQSLGGSMNSVGNTLIGLSAPVVAFGAYAVKATTSFEQGMAEVQAISGATAKELEDLKDKAKEMGATTKFSASESAEAMKYMAMAGWKTSDMVSGISGVMDLAAASGENLGSVADILTDGLTAFGMAAGESGRMADVLASASSNANTNVAMLGESFKYVAPVAGAMNYTIEDTALALGLMANAGIKGSQSGTALRTAITNMVKPTDNMEMIMRRYNITLQNTDGSQKSLVQVVEMLRDKFGGLEEDVQAADVAMLFGKEAMAGMLAVINASPADFNKLKGAIDNSNGSAKEMAEIMNNTAQGQITLLKSQLEGLAIQIGEKLLPHVNDFVAGLSDLISWFGNLDEATQQNIIKMGLFSFGAGSALKVLGGFTTGIGKTVEGVGKLIPKLGDLTGGLGNAGSGAGAATGAIAKLAGGAGLGGLLPVMISVVGGAAVLGTAYAGVKTHSELMQKSVATSREELSWFERVVADVTGTTFESAEALEQAGIKAKSFSDNVSEDFKASVLEAEKSVNNLTLSLRDMNLDNTFTESEQADFKSRVNTICQGAIDTINGRKEEAQSELKELLMADGVIDETEQKTLDFLGRQFDTNTEKVSETEKAVYAIIEQGLADKGYLNSEEIAQVEEHLAIIQGLKLESEATNNDELMEAKADFLARVKTMDIEEATALLQEKASLRDSEIEEISLKYDKQIELLKLKNENATEEERVANEATIASLEQAKSDQLALEQQKWEEYLSIVEANNPAVLEKINQFTGEAISEADAKKIGELTKLKETYPEMLSITETGLYKVQNAMTGAYSDMYITVDTATGEITGAWDSAQRKAGGLTEQMAKDAKNMGSQVKKDNDNLVQSIKGLSNGYVNSNGEIVNANGKVVASLKDFTKEADGTGQGILELNGKKIEVKSNTKGEIQNFTDLKKKMDEVNGRKLSATVTVTYKEVNKPSGSVGNNLTVRTAPTPMSARTFGISEDYMETLTTPMDIASLFSERQWSGGLFSATQKTSKALGVLNIPRGVEIQQGTQEQIDTKSLAQAVAQAVAQAISGVTLKGNVQLDTGAVVGTVSNGIARNAIRRR